MSCSLNKEYKRYYKKISKILEKEDLNYYFYCDADMHLYQYILQCQKKGEDVDDTKVVIQRILDPKLEQSKTEHWMSYFLFPLGFNIISLVLMLFCHDYFISTNYFYFLFVMSIAFGLLFLDANRFSIIQRILIIVATILILVFVLPLLPTYRVALSFATIFVIIILSFVFLLCIHNHVKRTYIDWKNNL